MDSRFNYLQVRGSQVTVPTLRQMISSHRESHAKSSQGKKALEPMATEPTTTYLLGNVLFSLRKMASYRWLSQAKRLTCHTWALSRGTISVGASPRVLYKSIMSDPCGKNYTKRVAAPLFTTNLSLPTYIYPPPLSKHKHKLKKKIEKKNETNSRYFNSSSLHCPSCFSLVDSTGWMVKNGGKL